MAVIKLNVNEGKKRTLESTTKNRASLIDNIEEYYNSPDYKHVEEVFIEVTGKDINNVDDSDPKEGFYAEYTTEELQKVLNELEGSSSGTVSIEGLTHQQYSLIKSAMEMFANPSFSKSREESQLAKQILKKMQEG